MLPSAIVVHTKDRGWVTIDTSEIKPEPVRYWISSWSRRSIDGKARVYVTDPSKLSIDLGSYDRVQLGLDLPKEDDWFKGYFVDLVQSMRTVPLAQLGLAPLPRVAKDFVDENSAASTAESRKAKDTKTFGFLWDFIVGSETPR